MSTHPVLQQRHIAQVVDAFFAFFEWTHGITFGPRERASLQNLMIARWDDTSAPAGKLAGYIASLWDQVQSQPLNQRDYLRPQAHDIIQRLLMRAGGRGPVLATLHHMLETVRPGSSGVPLPLGSHPQAATTPVPATAAPAYASPSHPWQPHPPHATPAPTYAQPPYSPYQHPQAGYAAVPAASSGWPVGPGHSAVPATPEELYEEKLRILADEQAIQRRLAIDEAIKRSTQRVLDSMSR